ncbi:tetratricopeptide repeat protein 22-like [Asterias amurensis]|uniref:tetratricopeptide repeat protein 22-like n=1 Tax=Asterias amurensis TaxID=7602 RepID=UPI003AB85E27
MASVIIPGHFMLPLPINKDINIDKAAVETKIRVLSQFQQVRVGRPEELAILNLQGILTTRLRRYEDSLVYFHQVLNKDPENLNALANLQYVLEKLFRLSEAQDAKDEWTRLIHSKDPVALNCLKARCVAEHAYAYAFDVHSDTKGAKRYKQSNQLYREALTLAGGDVKPAEYHDWIFNMAIAQHTLFDRLWYENDPEAGGYIDDAVTYFFKITRMIPEDSELQWDSWRHLADIFRVLKIRKIAKTEIAPGLKEFQENPEKCMQKAMEITPNNPRLLARYANFLYSLNREIQKPLELLEQSINLDSTEFNFYAFTTRAMLTTKFYKHRMSQQKPKTQDSAELAFLRNTLQVAKSDLKKAMSMHVTPWDLMHLGEVYYLLARNHTQQDNEIRNLVEKALLQLTRASDCQDGYMQKELYSIRGRCLFDIGEKRSAIACFKQAIDCEPSNSKYTGNFNELFDVYLNILQDEELDDRSIIAETAFFLKEALVKYGSFKMGKFCIGQLGQHHNRELLLIEEYCTKYTKEYHDVVRLLQARTVSGTTATRKESKLHLAWVRTLPSSRAWRVEQAEASAAGIAADGAAATTAAAAAEGSAVSVPAVAEDTRSEKEVKSLESEVARMSFKELPQEQKQPIRKAPDEARIQQFENDFCVIYPENQTGWVSYDLLNELEAVRKLKGYIQDRDSVPGTFKISNEIEMMTKCASILLVINEDFQKECEHSMIHALEMRKDRENPRYIIPILRDNSKVPVEVNIFNTFEAIGAVDWDKLANAIEQQVYA